MPVGVSGMGIGGAASGGGRVGGFAIPEFQGATLAGLSAFRDLLYESKSDCCCCLMMASGVIVGAGRGTGA